MDKSMDNKVDKEGSFFKDYSELSESIQALSKTEENPFFHSKYVSLTNILEEAKRVCKAHNFIFIQAPIVRDDGKDILETYLIHKNGKLFTSQLPLVRKDMEDPQKLGTALTYMRRYSLTAILGIQEEDDDGNKASTPKLGITPKTALSVRSTLSQEEVAEHEPRGKSTVVDNVREILRMAIAMRGTDKAATEYVLGLASFESKKEPGKIIFPKWEKFITNDKWVHIVLKKIEVEFEKWMKNEDSMDVAPNEDSLPF